MQTPPTPTVKNTFSNDGSFLEQFKKMRKGQDESKPAAPKMFNPADKDALKEEKPPEADDWYKQALDKARQIAHNMKQPASTAETDIIKTEVKPESGDFNSNWYSSLLSHIAVFMRCQMNSVRPNQLIFGAQPHLPRSKMAILL